MKLQSQNEQFRILIKSFQIDSTSVLRAQRPLSTNGECPEPRPRREQHPWKVPSDPDETVLLLNNDTKSVHHEETDDEQLRLYQDVKPRHAYIPNWHSGENVAHYSPSGKVETPEQQINSHYYPSSTSSSSSAYRTIPGLNSKGSSATSDNAFMIGKPSQPSQRTYKTNSLDQTNENGIVILERCQLRFESDELHSLGEIAPRPFSSRAQSVDTNNNTNNSSTSSSSSNVLHHPVSRRNLQTIVEAIRHLEGDDALSNITPQQSSSSTPQEDLPAQIKAMIHEKFQQQTNKSAASNALYQQTINIYEQSSTPVPQINSSLSHDIDLHQKPPKKRKITYNENDDIIEQPTPLPKHGSWSISLLAPVTGILPI